MTAAYSPQGDRIVTACVDGTARVWLVHTDDLLRLADERISRGFTEDELRKYAELLDR